MGLYSIQHFWLDELAAVRSTSTVVLIAVGLLACDRSGSQASSNVSADTRDSSNRAALRESASLENQLVSSTGMGGIRLGMTLDEARRAVPTAKFQRTSDGEGIALVEVVLAPGSSMIVWAHEDDPDAPVDWSKTIRMIETFSPVFHTAEGVHAGSLVADVEKIYGKIREIAKSEIESREYIVFDKQPAGVTFRLNHTGVFPDGSRTTTEIGPGAMIQSITVSSSSR